MIVKCFKKICQNCQKIYYFPISKSFVQTSFCSRKCASIDKWKNSRSTYLKPKIIEKVLLLKHTLQTVGDYYGISRERVRQIVESQGISYKKVKEGLINESDKFKCIVCSRVKQKNRLSSNFCSITCANFYKYYDFSALKTCPVCKKEFYPFRNHKFYKFIKNRYCSFKCYTKVFKNCSKESTFSPNFIEKLENRLKNIENIIEENK